ncbi:MAG TPA: hypothetical protein VGN85_08880, partial [Methyloceanibacter sp.]|nr:hypothetical protein [Methyloceanibacter sp.]
ALLVMLIGLVSPYVLASMPVADEKAAVAMGPLLLMMIGERSPIVSVSIPLAFTPVANRTPVKVLVRLIEWSSLIVESPIASTPMPVRGREVETVYGVVDAGVIDRHERHKV